MLPKSSPPPTGDAEIGRIQTLLDALPATLEPLDPSAIDGLLCAVLVQPEPIDQARWLALAIDANGRAAPPGLDLTELQALLCRRHAELDRAIGERQWFDPWIFELEPPAELSDSLLPWIAGFALAVEQFDRLLALADPRLFEPLALLYQHLDPDDLDAEPALLDAIDVADPPEDLAEAAEDIVRAVLLLADVGRPQPARRRDRPAQPAHGGDRRRGRR